MLILASITIKVAIDGGLFDYAKKAKKETENAIAYEQELINEMYNLVDDKVNETPGGGTEEGGATEAGTYPTALKDAQGFLEENATYKTNGDTAVVPKGFKVVPGIENTMAVADGLVIQDKIGNEFVWIPVTFEVAEGSTKDSNGLYPEFLAVFYRSAWDGNARTSTLTSTSFPSSSSATWSDYTEPYASGYTTPEGKTESEEYYEMMRSVQENKGFYIGRYEAGIKTGEIPRIESTRGTSNMVVQRDCYPYTYVGWGNAMGDYTSEIILRNANVWIQGNTKNMGIGALYLSKHMYDGQDIGATSTLCYGIQWDAMLDFIKLDFINYSSHNVTRSTDWGNYRDNEWTITRTEAKFSDTYGETWTQVLAEEQNQTSGDILLTTGASDSFAAKNIYDVAGNVYEWTNEANSYQYRVLRGGCYGSYSDEHPAAYRTIRTNPNVCDKYTGFRPALYIKNS